MSHAVRMPSFGPAEPAYLPNVGDVYLVSPQILGSRAHGGADGAVPVVVLAVSAHRHGRITVAVRTSSRIAAGVSHGAAPQLGLPRPGVWTNVATVDKSLWTPHDARWRGPLERVVFEEVRERFQ